MLIIVFFSRIFSFKNLIDSEKKCWAGYRLCTQDIFEHKRNVTQAVQENEVKAFKDFCSKALSVIQEIGPFVKY